ncbi:transposase, partial [uncultured Halovibrio sp.]|uniref:IS110 family transposase n=1 Tax=uncultured Halovibrio sp. TaxID=985049 RepID=UPI0025D3FC88
MDEQGNVMEQREVATDTEQLNKVLAPFAPVSAVVESSPLAEWACQVLEDAGHLAQIIDARAAKHLMDARKKTDRRDAQTLAQIVRSGWFQPVHRKSDSARL